MSSVCDNNEICLTREIPRMDHCSYHSWNSDPHKGMPSQFINYQKVIDKGAIIKMQIKEVAKWSNRGNL